MQARIDEATAKVLQRLRRQTGLSDSELVRKGLALVSESVKPTRGMRVRGVGKFASGHRDLGSNKARLAGFGKK